ncbi:COMM domain-containing protein 2 [Ischnura elegans]|uniref:COMM domain-containing protein 2 n=1 Tax=Ischnura elegans TaxID=197161 RepID=UPI001ED86BDF|nr:COMM domain-containing protein 2 [Ischnura elegans]
MLLFLTEAHKRHLGILSEQPLAAFKDICTVASSFFLNGPDVKLVQESSQKLEIPPQHLQHAVEALVKLLIESFRNKLKADEFSRTSQALGFSEEQRELLLKIFEDEGKRLGQHGGLLIPPHYHNLEWRFETQVASRSLMHQLTPLVTLRLQLKDSQTNRREKVETHENENKSTHVQTQTLQIDPVSLFHITGILEQALAEGSSRHCRRIQRSLE